MSQLSMNPLSMEEQQRMANQMYILLGKQVKSYHKHCSLGENTSVPVDLAQELMESIEYTMELAGGFYCARNIEEALKIGQDMLDSRVQKAKTMLHLVIATAPKWQTDCRWEALRCIERYLSSYDHLHLAHRMPDELFYPILASVPKSSRGIDYCLFFLNIMWLENQIMAGVDDSEQGQLCDRLPQDTLNQCEQLLINGIGKAIIAPCLNGLVFSENEHAELCSALREKTSEEIRKKLEDAAERLCIWLNLTEENAITYAKAAVPQLQLRLEGAIVHSSLAGLFL